ncbi:MAG: DUF433 domain-containing protein [Saprospiraceae bacterium]|jgi:uncharacterized protein (DUF433 family)|uniref:DUF433 domain-containing protein n=1 Tax=Candidatus Brachybacter algidus TaxID=2982024 RepID=UPI001B57DA7A|nr:DUF433 domain-containing protein [Candidatus Brachybacter algidus]MBP7305708.1 DUF433 domain-containing protein [Saprospiraceae bacterium]MBK6371926.1 DUF433 domain-containing protein [Candidatus Brachybacter algidus]MBK6448746.1 DUF433 domain-containing protein [Candidatus Brachybacter algidus]MBK7603656.1 DUF433 domain-containing protein [Candidatus Brachybacter algidus]MBK8357071.1 DUF433 domain-containing protein [Candidatus Brachybacter algidus]
MEKLNNYIHIDASIRFGKPVIIGTRITVDDILSWLSSGMTIEEIESDFPYIKREHVLAALAFAANREQSLRLLKVV